MERSLNLLLNFERGNCGAPIFSHPKKVSQASITAPRKSQTAEMRHSLHDVVAEQEAQTSASSGTQIGQSS
jgi:hypothetical protein